MLIQYFVDTDIKLDKIKYIIPTGYHPVKLAPNKALKELKNQASQYTPGAIITDPVKDKSIVKNLQADGISVFDKAEMPSKFHQKNFNEFQNDLKKLFDSLDLD